MRAALALALTMLAYPTLTPAHDAPHQQRLATIGPAPELALTSQDGAPVALEDFRRGDGG